MAKRKKARKARKAHKSSARKSARRHLTKRQRAARKAVRTRKRNQAMRSRRAKKANRTRIRRHGRGKRFGAAREVAAASPRRRKRRKARHAREEEAPAAASPRRKKGRRKAKRRSGKRVSPKRRAAALKAARTRARNKNKRRRASRKGGRRRARKAAHRRAGVKSGAHGTSHKGYRYESDPYAGEGRGRRKKGRRRSRRHHHAAHMARMPNPVSGPAEFGLALLGLLAGGLTTIATDRFFGATHALVASTPAGTQATSFADTPKAGQVYNSVGPATPIWSNWKRLVNAIGNIVVPFGLSAWLGKGRPGVKSLFQLWGFSSLTVTTVKVGTDGAAMFFGKQTWLNGLGPRLFAPEIDAANALATAAKTTLASYTLVAGGTGPAPAPAAVGNATLGAPGATMLPGGSACPPGYAKNSDGHCVAMPPENQPPRQSPPGMQAPPPALPPETSQPPVFTQPPNTNVPPQAPPYFTPPASPPVAPPSDGGYEPPGNNDCGFDACAGDPAFSCAPDKLDF